MTGLDSLGPHIEPAGGRSLLHKGLAQKSCVLEDRISTRAGDDILPVADEVMNAPRIEDNCALEISAEATPLEFLESVYRSVDQPMNRRLRAAIEAAQYRHPRLAVTASVTSEGIATMLDRAIERSRVQPRLIEAEKISAASLLGAPVAK
jgi:hypothetical protein